MTFQTHMTVVVKSVNPEQTKLKEVSTKANARVCERDGSNYGVYTNKYT
jgi:hypothetical protein